MNQELKYIFETVVIVAVLFIAYQAYLVVKDDIIYVGFILLGTVALSIPIMAGLVLWHGHKAFLSGGTIKKITRRKKVE